MPWFSSPSRNGNDELYLDEPDRGDALSFRREVTALATAGRLLANADIAGFMVKCFGQTKGQFADHLLSALEAAAAAGGEAGPVHSAGLKVAHQLSWPYIELRADWSETPIEDLRAAWEIYKPQAQAYVQRAIDPTLAPSYGVPGDL